MRNIDVPLVVFQLVTMVVIVRGQSDTPHPFTSESLNYNQNCTTTLECLFNLQCRNVNLEEKQCQCSPYENWHSDRERCVPSM